MSLPSGLDGVWRKDEFQWMSLALVGDRKCIEHLCISYYSLIECTSTFLQLLFFHYHAIFCLRGSWWDGVKEDVWRGKVKGNRLNQVHLEGWLLNQHVCVCAHSHFTNMKCRSWYVLFIVEFHTFNINLSVIPSLSHSMNVLYRKRYIASRC